MSRVRRHCTITSLTSCISFRPSLRSKTCCSTHCSAEAASVEERRITRGELPACRRLGFLDALLQRASVRHSAGWPAEKKRLFVAATAPTRHDGSEQLGHDVATKTDGRHRKTRGFTGFTSRIKFTWIGRRHLCKRLPWQRWQQL